MEFHYTEAEVKQEIRGLQARLPNLCLHESYQAISTGPLTPGCAICTRMAHTVVQLGFRCNARCPFCFLEVADPNSAYEHEQQALPFVLQHFRSRQNESKSRHIQRTSRTYSRAWENWISSGLIN
jgi:uncharacterized radical SAM superfamily Fe-S cluster-containing enzyme